MVFRIGKNFYKARLNFKQPLVIIVFPEISSLTCYAMLAIICKYLRRFIKYREDIFHRIDERETRSESLGKMPETRALHWTLQGKRLISLKKSSEGLEGKFFSEFSVRFDNAITT